MIAERRSFFERLTGSVPAESGPGPEEESFYQQPRRAVPAEPQASAAVSAAGTGEAHLAANRTRPDWLQSDEEGQLTVDMFQTPEHIVIQSTVAGVEKDQIDVALTRDMVTIRGKRAPMFRVGQDDYFNQELYWGAFARSVLLPQEIDTEAAEATMKNGLLTIKMPKLDKNRVQKIRVRGE